MDPADRLREMGFKVKQFNECHFRVNDEIDYWLPRGKWYDRLMRDRGQKPLDQLPYFIQRRLKQRPDAPEGIFIQRLVGYGWTRERARQAWEIKTSNAKSREQLAQS